MESKEIFAVILAALGIIIVISILSMVTKNGRSGEQSSEPEITQLTQQEPVYLETDIWDVLREQNTTTAVTEETLPEGTDVTAAAEGTTDTDVPLVTGDMTAIGMPQVEVGSTPDGETPASTVSDAGTETETTAVTVLQETQPAVQTYVLQLP